MTSLNPAPSTNGGQHTQSVDRPDRPPSRWRRRRVFGAAVLSLTLVASACGGSGDTSTAAPASTASTAADNGGAEAAVPANALDPSILSGSAVTHIGDSFDLGSLAGQDLVVWFWAPW